MELINIISGCEIKKTRVVNFGVIFVMSCYIVVHCSLKRDLYNSFCYTRFVYTLSISVAIFARIDLAYISRREVKYRQILVTSINVHIYTKRGLKDSRTI